MYFLLLPDRVILQRPSGQFQMLPCQTCQIIQESKMYLFTKLQFLAKSSYWWGNRMVENYS